jgi:hypothetical protein
MAIAVILVVIVTGLMCSCVATAKRSNASFERRNKALIAELRDPAIANLSKEKLADLVERTERHLSRSSETSPFALARDAADNLGNTFNHSQTAILWDAFFNKSFLGRLFTQNVLVDPLNVMISFLTTTAAFIARDYYEHWVLVQPDPIAARQNGMVALLVFLIALSSARSMIESYSRHNQGELIEGRDLEE